VEVGERTVEGGVQGLGGAGCKERYEGREEAARGVCVEFGGG
jgi:hypothetical protein